MEIRSPRKDVQEKEKEKAIELLEEETFDELRKYLCSSIFPQVGPITAKKVVSALGSQTIKVIEKSGHELYQIRDIGRRRASSIIEGWLTQRRLKKTCLILLSQRNQGQI
jgi:ERCC4-type nuclease